MKINDLETKSGLDRATIRYYEKEGMITPCRHDNGYRSYSEDDLEQLMKIKLLRQLDVPISKIKELQQGNAVFQTVLQEQIQYLETKRDNALRSAQVCRMIQADGVTYSMLNAKYYLDKFRAVTPLESGHENRSYTFYENIQRPFHPILHGIARGIDYTLFAIAILFIEIVFLRLRTEIIWIPVIFVMPLWIPFEALCYRFLGTTPGKWALGIRVDSEDGCKLDIRSAFSRAFRVFHEGLGWGIPVLSYWMLYKSYIFYRDSGYLTWDDHSDVTYHIYTRSTRSQGIRLIAIILAMVILGTGISYSWQMPRYSNGIAIHEFAICYNDLETILMNTVPNLGLNGKFMDVDGSALVRTRGNFTYSTANGKVTGISYWENWENFGLMQAMPNACLHAAATLLYAIEGKNEEEIECFEEDLLNAVAEALENGTNELTFTNEIVQIHWRISYTVASPDGYHLNAMFEENATARVDVEITLK